MTGTIKKIVSDRGFGFIKCADNGKEVFFHLKNLTNVTFEQLKEGDSLTFETQETEKGMQAVRIAKP